MWYNPHTMSNLSISQAQMKITNIRHIFLGNLIYGLGGVIVAVMRPTWMHSDSALICLAAVMVGMSFGGLQRAGQLRALVKG
jgi:hypothetical protein